MKKLKITNRNPPSKPRFQGLWDEEAQIKYLEKEARLKKQEKRSMWLAFFNLLLGVGISAIGIYIGVQANDLSTFTANQDTDDRLDKLLDKYNDMTGAFLEMEPLLTYYRLDRDGKIVMEYKDIHQREKELEFIQKCLWKITDVEEMFPDRGFNQIFTITANKVIEWRVDYLRSIACKCDFNPSKDEFERYKKIIQNVLIFEDAVKPHIAGEVISINAALDSLVKKQGKYILDHGLNLNKE